MKLILNILSQQIIIPIEISSIIEQDNNKITAQRLLVTYNSLISPLKLKYDLNLDIKNNNTFSFIDITTNARISQIAFVSDNQQGQEIVDSENHDRKTIYSYIAEKEGATLEFVGQRRAKHISENATPGEFLQKEDGSWYQK